MMSIGEIYNFVQIDPSTGTAGQPTQAQFSELRDAGYEAVINLAPDGLDTSLPDEAALVRALGMEYHHIPVQWTEPRRTQLDEFSALMDRLAGRRVLIHCQGNYRVTAFYALYAGARLGWSTARGDALIDRIWTSHPGFVMDETWRGFIAAARAG
jgi:uncharacterized protein (TIGR01244 family)